jgi:hypothetical protein
VSAGLPGAGLAGVFFLVSALIAVPIEVVRTLRGRSSLAEWKLVARHAALALAMLAALDLCFLGVMALITALRGHSQAVLLPVAPVLLTLAVLVLLIVTVKVASLVARATSSTD